MITPTGTLHDLANDITLSGDALTRLAAKRAGALREAGLAQSGGMFVITHANTASFFADLFAVWSLGGCAACVNAGLTAHELQTVVDFVDARAILTDGETSRESKVPKLRLADTDADPALTREFSPDAPALILFTSGTTGAPKGVVQTFGSIAKRLQLNAEHIGSDTLAKTLCTLPTHFGHGLIGNCLTPLCHGGEVFIGAPAGLPLAAGVGGLIDTHEITFLSSVPAFWKLATRMSPPPTGRSLKRIHIGSAQLSKELWTSVIDWSQGADVVNMYGTTETANWIGGASSAQYAPEDGLLGTLWGGEACILDSGGQRQPAGTGEIVVRTPSVMAGYHKRDDLTRDVIDSGWYRTGDVGTIDAAGVLRLTGRARYMINIAGIKVYPEELDLLFERHDDVLEVCAFGIDDAVSGEVVGMAVTLVKDTQLSEKSLIAWAKDRIRAEALPRRIFVVDDIPKSPRGKVNRSQVASYCLEGSA